MAKIDFLIFIIIAGLVLFSTNFPLNNADYQITKIDLNQSFKLSYNQTASYDSGNILIYFKGINEDSRCPSDVVCEWPGQVIIDLDIKINQTIYNNLKLKLGPIEGNQSEAIIGDYKITLLNVDPYPVSIKKPKETDYQILLTLNHI